MKANEELDGTENTGGESSKVKNLRMLIGLILINEISLKTKDLRLTNDSKEKYTTSNIMHELNCITSTKGSNGQFINHRALTKNQKDILNAFDITEKQLNDCLIKFNKRFLFEHGNK